MAKARKKAGLGDIIKKGIFFLAIYYAFYFAWSMGIVGAKTVNGVDYLLCAALDYWAYKKFL